MDYFDVLDELAKAIQAVMDVKGEAYTYEIAKALDIDESTFNDAFKYVTGCHIWGTNKFGTIVWHNTYYEPS